MRFSCIFKYTRNPNTILKDIPKMSHTAVKHSLKKMRKTTKKGLAGQRARLSSQELFVCLFALGKATLS